jgi:hypothetical protein
MTWLSWSLFPPSILIVSKSSSLYLSHFTSSFFPVIMEMMVIIIIVILLLFDSTSKHSLLTVSFVSFLPQLLLSLWLSWYQEESERETIMKMMMILESNVCLCRELFPFPLLSLSLVYQNFFKMILSFLPFLDSSVFETFEAEKSVQNQIEIPKTRGKKRCSAKQRIVVGK